MTLKHVMVHAMGLLWLGATAACNKSGAAPDGAATPTDAAANGGGNFGSSGGSGGIPASGGAGGASGASGGATGSASGGSGASFGASGGGGGALQGGGGIGNSGGIVSSTGGSGATAGRTGAGSGGNAGGGNAAGTGGGSTGGATGGGGAGATPGNGTPPLPVPAGSNTVPPPTGTAANLKVLPWAGFKAAVTYSFDDSQQSQIDHWTDLRAANIRATYYISTGNQALANYDAVLREAISLGNELGNHTAHHCHSDLTGCIAGTPSATMAAEIDGCTDYGKSTLNAPTMWSLAYPFGDLDFQPETRSRFLLGRSTHDGAIGWADTTDPYTLPIKAAAGGETAAVLNGFIDTTRTQGKWLIFLFHTLRPDPQTEHAYADIDIGSVTGSIAHVKSLSDVWVDTVVSVGAYWLGERTIRGAAQTTSGGTTIWRWTLPAHFPPGRFVRVTVGGGTLMQGNAPLIWDGHGYYEVALDPGTLTWSP